jgi:hypothetical protein
MVGCSHTTEFDLADMFGATNMSAYEQKFKENRAMHQSLEPGNVGNAVGAVFDAGNSGMAMVRIVHSLTFLDTQGNGGSSS